MQQANQFPNGIELTQVTKRLDAFFDLVHFDVDSRQVITTVKAGSIAGKEALMYDAALLSDMASKYYEAICDLGDNLQCVNKVSACEDLLASFTALNGHPNKYHILRDVQAYTPALMWLAAGFIINAVKALNTAGVEGAPEWLPSFAFQILTICNAVVKRYEPISSAANA